MFGDDEVVIFAVDEKCWNIGLLDVLSDRVQILNIEIVLHITCCTFYFMVDLRKLRAIPLKIERPPPCFYASYFDNFSRLEKGESRTRHPI